MANHVAAIHALKGKLRLSDDDYRVLLHQLTGHTSSKDCSAAQQQQVRDHMQRLAERMGVADAGRRARFQESYKQATPRERKVWAIWKDMGRRGLVQHANGQALDSFVYRQTGMSALRFCTPAQQDGVIEALKLWQRRGHEVR